MDSDRLRKARGAFFTPPGLARYLVDWAIRTPDDRVLEPSCGEASFLLAAAIAEDLRQRGLRGTKPAPLGQLHASGAERRMAGGIGAKKVDVTWATEEGGLLLGISIKGINFRDQGSFP